MLPRLRAVGQPHVFDSAKPQFGRFQPYILIQKWVHWAYSWGGFHSALIKFYSVSGQTGQIEGISENEVKTLNSILYTAGGRSH